MCLSNHLKTYTWLPISSPEQLEHSLKHLATVLSEEATERTFKYVLCLRGVAQADHVQTGATNSRASRVGVWGPTHLAEKC